MTKTELVAAIAAKQCLSDKEVGSAVNTILNIMMQSLEKGGRMEFRGFGSFSVNKWGPRHARNPVTGESWRTDPVHAVHFKAGKALRAAVLTGFLAKKPINIQLEGITDMDELMA